MIYEPMLRGKRRWAKPTRCPTDSNTLSYEKIFNILSVRLVLSLPEPVCKLRKKSLDIYRCNWKLPEFRKRSDIILLQKFLLLYPEFLNMLPSRSIHYFCDGRCQKCKDWSYVCKNPFTLKSFATSLTKITQAASSAAENASTAPKFLL